MPASSPPPLPQPDDRASAAPAARWPLALALALLLGGSATSLWAWRASADYLMRQADAEFERYSELSFNNIGQRVQHQIDVLAGFQALFRTSESVSRAEFHRYFNDLRVQARFPGLLAVQYAQVVTAAQRPAFEAAVRADTSLQPRGYPEFAIHPEGQRDRYLVVTYNEPMQGNEPAFGHDNTSNAPRREVVERARDTGSPQASGPVMLLQQRAGVLVRLPLYRRGAAIDTLAQRRAAYTGQVSGVLLLEDLLRDTLPTHAKAPYQVRVMDHGLVDDPNPATARSQALVARTPAGVTGALWTSPATQPSADDRQEHILAMAGRSWTIEVARPHMNQALAPFPLLLLGGGLAISLLLSLLAGRLTLLRHRAQKLALAMSQQARANAARLDAVFNSTGDAIITVDRHGTMLSVNHAAQTIFGHSAARMVGHSLSLLMPLGAASQVSRWLTPAPALATEPAPTGVALRGADATGRTPAVEGRHRALQARRADGSLFAIELEVSEMLVDGQRQYVGLLRDMSQAEAAQARIAAAAQALQAANVLREAVFTHAAFALIVADAQGLIQAMNPAAERLLGCSAQDEVGRAQLTSFLEAADQDVLTHVLQQHTDAAQARQQRGQRGSHLTPGSAPVDTDFFPRSIENTLHFKRRDGHQVPVSVTVSALHDSQGRVNGFLSIAYDITERQRLAKQLSQLAYHDGLTGLPNRLCLEDHLRQAIAKSSRSQEPLALLFIDLDRFKPINDTYGHSVGDQVLCEIARRVQATLRSADMVARLGGDEFVVLLSTLASPDDCLVVADKLLLTLTEPMQVGGHQVQVGASIGLARYPDSGNTAAELLRNADAAMYQNKLAGRSTVRLAAQVDRPQSS